VSSQVEIKRSSKRYPIYKRNPDIIVSSLLILIIGLYSWGVYLGVTWLKTNSPHAVTLDVFGSHITIDDFHERILNNLIFISVIIPGSLFIEAMCCGWARSSLKRLFFTPNKSITADLGLLLADVFLLLPLLKKIMTLGLSVSFGVVLHAKITQWAGFEIGFAVLPGLMILPACFVFMTFCDYWTHRVYHTSPFWPMHRFHHSSTDFCMVTSLKHHPGEFAGLFITAFPMAVLGAPIETMITLGILVPLHGMFTHSNIESDWGWFGKWVLQSPLHHRLHHKLDHDQGHKNLGIIPIWDHIFKTYQTPPKEPFEIGVKQHYNHGLLFGLDILRDYYDFWKNLALIAYKFGLSGFSWARRKMSGAIL